MTQRKDSSIQIVFNGDDVQLHRLLKAKAAMEGITLQSLLIKLIKKELGKED